MLTSCVDRSVAVAVAVKYTFSNSWVLLLRDKEYWTFFFFLLCIACASLRSYVSLVILLLTLLTTNRRFHHT